MAARDPLADLRRIAYLLERAQEKPYRVRAFRGAVATLGALPPGEVERRVAEDSLTALPGIGEVTAGCVVESLRGELPAYLRRLEDAWPAPGAPGAEPDADHEGGGALLAALRGDCHAHSDWSDGGSPIEEMVRAAIGLGHEYLVLTDHSPRLTVARGLSADRLREQLDVVAGINEELARVNAEAGDGPGFRLLTGIEVDILADGSLDQEDDLLARLDVVVASVHSRLADDPATMTGRLVTALANPHMDILGHCTGRLVTGKGRPESRFDPGAVFAAAAANDKAIEINCRPERLDPPRRLLRLAVAAGCRFSIDTDAHAPGQLEWQGYGCHRAVECGVPADRVVNTMPAKDLLAWTGTRDMSR